MSRTLKESEIDFERYMQRPPEAAYVRPASYWKDAVVDYFYGEQAQAGCFLPWRKTHDAIRLRRAELSIWAGVNGHGKSLLLNQIMLAAMWQSERVCIASMEMKPLQTMQRMTRQAVGTEQPGIEHVRKFHGWTDDKLWLYDQQGTVRYDRMLAVIRYCHNELHITHFVIDSLMKCGIAVDDLNNQKAFIDELSTFAKDTGMHIHVVAHSRKRATDDSTMNKFDVKGAGEITDMADNVFTLWRNKPKEAAIQKGEASPEQLDQPDAILICDKQRNGEWEGRIGLWFVKKALQFVAKDTTQAIDFLNWHTFGAD